MVNGGLFGSEWSHPGAGPGPSEAVIDKALEGLGYGPDDVVRVFSERIPCEQHECAVTLAKYKNLGQEIYYGVNGTLNEAKRNTGELYEWSLANVKKYMNLKLGDDVIVVNGG